MANVFYGDRWVIDTPSATPITLQSIFVKSIRWTGKGVINGEAKVTDNTNQTRWHKYAPTADFALDSGIENWYYEGFTVPVLTGGELIIDLK